MRLQAWTAAAEVLDAFRRSFPEHELQGEATKQLAFVYRENGQLALSAGEFERVATESDDPELRREALLEAGELYEQGADIDGALAAYVRYVTEFPRPVEVAVGNSLQDRRNVRDQRRASASLPGASGNRGPGCGRRSRQNRSHRVPRGAVRAGLVAAALREFADLSSPSRSSRASRPSASAWINRCRHSKVSSTTRWRT